MQDCAPVSTLMIIGCKLNKEDDSSEVDQTMYMSMIGIFLYLTTSRPDITQVLVLVGRFQSNPKETHIHVVKRIFMYMQNTIYYGLWYTKNIDLTLKDYTYVDWVGSVKDRKRTSGGAFFLGNYLVSWLNKEKTSISFSTDEAEYIATTTSCCNHVLWIKNNLNDIQVPCDKPISIMCDNTSATNISKNHFLHSKTKHIPIKYHFLREQILDRVVKLEYIPSKEKIEDIFTKPLPIEYFDYLRQWLRVISSSLLP
jgi:hypothetical protein